MKTTTDPRIIRLAAFFKRHDPALRAWPRSALLGMLEWYWRDSRVGIVMRQGKIVAAATARCVNDPAEARDRWHHDEKAPIVWVDDIASRHPNGIAALLHLLVERFGPRQSVGGQVFKRQGELRMLPFRVVERLSQPA